MQNVNDEDQDCFSDSPVQVIDLCGEKFRFMQECFVDYYMMSLVEKLTVISKEDAVVLEEVVKEIKKSFRSISHIMSLLKVSFKRLEQEKVELSHKTIELARTITTLVANKDILSVDGRFTPEIEGENHRLLPSIAVGSTFLTISGCISMIDQLSIEKGVSVETIVCEICSQMRVDLMSPMLNNVGNKQSVLTITGDPALKSVIDPVQGLSPTLVNVASSVSTKASLLTTNSFISNNMGDSSSELVNGIQEGTNRNQFSLLSSSNIGINLDKQATQKISELPTSDSIDPDAEIRNKFLSQGSHRSRGAQLTMYKPANKTERERDLFIERLDIKQLEAKIAEMKQLLRKAKEVQMSDTDKAMGDLEKEREKIRDALEKRAIERKLYAAILMKRIFRRFLFRKKVKKRLLDKLATKIQRFFEKKMFFRRLRFQIKRIVRERQAHVKISVYLLEYVRYWVKRDRAARLISTSLFRRFRTFLFRKLIVTTRKAITTQAVEHSNRLLNNLSDRIEHIEDLLKHLTPESVASRLKAKFSSSERSKSDSKKSREISKPFFNQINSLRAISKRLKQRLNLVEAGTNTVQLAVTTSLRIADLGRQLDNYDTTADEFLQVTTVASKGERRNSKTNKSEKHQIDNDMCSKSVSHRYSQVEMKNKPISQAVITQHNCQSSVANLSRKSPSCTGVTSNGLTTTSRKRSLCNQDSLLSSELKDSLEDCTLNSPSLSRVSSHNSVKNQLSRKNSTSSIVSCSSRSANNKHENSRNYGEGKNRPPRSLFSNVTDSEYEITNEQFDKVVQDGKKISGSFLISRVMQLGKNTRTIRKAHVDNDRYISSSIQKINDLKDTTNIKISPEVAYGSHTDETVLSLDRIRGRNRDFKTVLSEYEKSPKFYLRQDLSELATTLKLRGRLLYQSSCQSSLLSLNPFIVTPNDIYSIKLREPNNDNISSDNVDESSRVDGIVDSTGTSYECIMSNVNYLDDRNLCDVDVSMSCFDEGIENPVEKQSSLESDLGSHIHAAHQIPTHSPSTSAASSVTIDESSSFLAPIVTSTVTDVTNTTSSFVSIQETSEMPQVSFPTSQVRSIDICHD